MEVIYPHGGINIIIVLWLWLSLVLPEGQRRDLIVLGSRWIMLYQHFTPQKQRHAQICELIKEINRYCFASSVLFFLFFSLSCLSSLILSKEYSSLQRGIQLFLKWAIMQGFAMILQNRYQTQRLYTRIALVKARRMDVVWGETAGVEGQLLLLFPVLFSLQGFEAYVGLLYLKTAVTGFSSDWQVIVCGILLIIMAVGNFANTVQTLVTMSRVKAKIKKGKSRVELNQALDDKSL